jgi:hypothetical protein
VLNAEQDPGFRIGARYSYSGTQLNVQRTSSEPGDSNPRRELNSDPVS